MADATLTTDQFLAAEFVGLRLEHFKKLHLRTKKLVLEIIQYYLGTFHPFDDEAGAICIETETAKKANDEIAMAKCYQAFLEFLPIKLRSGIQGKNLFRQPTEADLILAHFYTNDLKEMATFNKALFEADKTGITEADRLRMMQAELERELSLPKIEKEEGIQPEF